MYIFSKGKSILDHNNFMNVFYKIKNDQTNSRTVCQSLKMTYIRFNFNLSYYLTENVYIKCKYKNVSQVELFFLVGLE